MSLALVPDPQDDLYEDDVDLDASYPEAIDAIKAELASLARAKRGRHLALESQAARYDAEIERLKARRETVVGPLRKRMADIDERARYLGEALRREELAVGLKPSGKLHFPGGTVSITKSEGVDWPDQPEEGTFEVLASMGPDFVRREISRSTVNKALAARQLVVSDGKVFTAQGEFTGLYLKETGSVSVSIKVD